MTTKLLAVDDSKTMRKVLEITFAGNTYDSTIVGSAEEALASVRANPPQLVVIDGHLGGQSGYDLCQRIKSEAPQVKVLLLSSKQRPFDAAKASSVGVDEHFDKPFDSTKFLDKLSQLELSPPMAAPEPVPVIATPPMPAATPFVAEPLAAAPVAVPIGSRPAAPPLSPAAEPTVARSTPLSSGASPLSSGASPRPAVVAPLGASAARPTSSAAARPVAATSASSSSGAKAPVAPLNGSMSDKLAQLGLTPDQVQGVLALSREVVEQVVWEVVPHLAETLIKEEIARLTAE